MTFILAALLLGSPASAAVRLSSAAVSSPSDLVRGTLPRSPDCICRH